MLEMETKKENKKRRVHVWLLPHVIYYLLNGWVGITRPVKKKKKREPAETATLPTNAKNIVSRCSSNAAGCFIFRIFLLFWFYGRACVCACDL